jgi:hypothetical protein
MEASLGTLRREAGTWSKQESTLQKGSSYARPNERQSAAFRPSGTGTANHEGDAAILAAVARVRARQAHASASPEAVPDPAG